MSNTEQPTVRPYILLTNDDGVESPGLHALASAVLPFADITIMAPSHQMTATGRGLFGDRNAVLETRQLEINGKNITAYHAPCSPAQIVILGVQVFGRDRQPDLLISGINYGENMGRDITMSGTVGAAIQAVCMGIPALAVSMETPIELHFEYGKTNWDSAAFFASKFARIMLERKMPADVDLLKVDVPQTATVETPWKVTRLAKSSYFTADIKKPTIASKLSDSEICALRNYEGLDKDSDIVTFARDKQVAVTPISLDFTSRTELTRLQEYLKNGSEN